MNMKLETNPSKPCRANPSLGSHPSLVEVGISG